MEDGESKALQVKTNKLVCVYHIHELVAVQIVSLFNVYYVVSSGRDTNVVRELCELDL